MRHNTGSGFKKPRMQKINVFYRNKTILDHLKHDPDTQQYLCIYRSRLFKAEIYYRLRILRIRAREFHIDIKRHSLTKDKGSFSFLFF